MLRINIVVLAVLNCSACTPGEIVASPLLVAGGVVEVATFGLVPALHPGVVAMDAIDCALGTDWKNAADCDDKASTPVTTSSSTASSTTYKSAAAESP